MARRKGATLPTRGAEQVDIHQRRETVLNLRKMGFSLRDIAAQVDVSHETVRSDIAAAMELSKNEIATLIVEIRALEAERLDDLYLAVSPTALGGHLGAVDRALKIMERRAKLLGLDAPERHEHTSDDWEAQAVQDIRDERLTYAALVEYFDVSTATRLFAKAGVPIKTESGPQ